MACMTMCQSFHDVDGPRCVVATVEEFDNADHASLDLQSAIRARHTSGSSIGRAESLGCQDLLWGQDVNVPYEGSPRRPLAASLRAHGRPRDVRNTPAPDRER